MKYGKEHSLWCMYGPLYDTLHHAYMLQTDVTEAGLVNEHQVCGMTAVTCSMSLGGDIAPQSGPDALVLPPMASLANYCPGCPMAAQL